MYAPDKYKYPNQIELKNRKWPDRVISTAPQWCSVDLRDGNQALPVPMNPAKKLEYFKMLVAIGFKDIEVGFPSASQDDFQFVRTLIEEKHIPDDVRISVLTQARKHLIDRTVESLQGVKQGLLHCYVATSDLHGRIVFNRKRDDVEKMAVSGTEMVKNAVYQAGMEGVIGYEFSPEEFTDSDLDFVVALCESVKETWGDSSRDNFILNLPATVERRPANQYADMIEYFCDNYRYREDTCISIHAHNDQGCAVAASEMALMAGADRAEGTLFGHGERTGNLDLVTIALNLYSRGINNKLDFSNMPEIVKIVEETSGIPVHPRHPYAGMFVFTAFSGSHQDAIRKGTDNLGKAKEIFQQDWKVPYLHIDPADLGREYERLIRINSQSGKGGIVFVLENEYGIYPPKSMHAEIGKVIQQLADSKGNEISAEELYTEFRRSFINASGPYELVRLSRVSSDDLPPDQVRVNIDVKVNGVEHNIIGVGNGPISAAVHGLTDSGVSPKFTLEDFAEQTTGKSADAKALAYIGIRYEDGKFFYGAGEHENIDQAALRALMSALNRASSEI